MVVFRVGFVIANFLAGTLLGGGGVVGENPLSIYMVGNLRTFRWLAPRLAQWLLSSTGLAGAPFYIFLHTWDVLESPDESWWKPAELQLPSRGFISRMLSDNNTNPLLDTCHATIGWGACFVHTVEPYIPEAIPLPASYNRSIYAALRSNKTHRYWRLWSLYVQQYALQRVHESADAFFRERLRRHRLASDLVLKMRPDAELRLMPDLAAARARAAVAGDRVLFGAPYRGGVSDVVFLTTVGVMQRLVHADWSSVLSATLRPEHSFRWLLRLFGISTVLGGFHVELCRLKVLQDGGLTLGQCYRKG